MPRDRIKLSDARALIAEGHATPESIAENFDVEDDTAAAAPTAPAVPRGTGRVRTPLLDRLGLSGADVKAGKGPQPASMGEKALGLGIDAVTGVADTLGGLVGLAGDVATLPARKSIAAARELVRSGSLRRASAASSAEPLLPLTKVAGEASEDFRTKARQAVGLDDSSETAAGPLVRLGTSLVVPIPGMKARPGLTRVAEEAAAPAEHAVETGLTAAQFDRLKNATYLGNPAAERQVPAKLREALNSGAISGDEASLQRFLVENPDVVDEVKAGYASPPGAPGATRTAEGVEAGAGSPAAAAEEPAVAATKMDPGGAFPSPGTVIKKVPALREFAHGLAPAAASEEAATAAGVIREAKAEIANAATVERYKYRDVAKTFDKAPDAANVENISHYEQTGAFKEEPTPGYSAFFKKSMDEAHDTLQAVYGDDRVGYVENYVRRAFKFASPEDEARGTAELSNYVGSLSASKSPLKARVLDMPLDEALQTMKDRGISVKPVTTNPELLRQWTVENANQARVYKEAWGEAKDKGLIQFVGGAQQRAPQGLVPLDDRVAQVFFPTDKGMVQAGRYYADPNVARVFNNAISKGLGGSPTFRAIRTINNAYNQFQLGFSGFHLTGTAINAGISDLSVGIQHLLQGDVASSAKEIGRSAVPGFSFVRDVKNGDQLLKDLAGGDPEAAKFLSEVLNPAGGRLGVDAAYRNTAYNNMVRAFRNRDVFRTIGNFPLAVVQKAAAPLMEYAIPRVKIGAFMDLASAQLQRLGPAASEDARRAVLSKAWDSIDNRFGQLTHDNLFWNKTARDLAQVSTRSVGWNLGTLRELGGGVADLAKGDIRSPRTLYSLALPIYAGLIGAAYHILHTGQRPQELRDYYYPKNGLTDKRGRADRTTLPTYMKDVFAYSDDPVGTVEHKASPLLSIAFDLGTNRDYFGDMIRNPEDPAAKRWEDNGRYALQQLRPFSVQQSVKTLREGGSPVQVGERFMGFVQAPVKMKTDAAEAEAQHEARKHRFQQMIDAARRRHQ